jgi:hypothetical protein
MASRAGIEAAVVAHGDVAPPSAEPDPPADSLPRNIRITHAAAAAGAAGSPHSSDDSNSSEASEEQASEDESEEEGAVDASRCDVCGSDASWEDSPIILCDGCDVAVHSLCYGVKVRYTPSRGLERRSFTSILPLIEPLPHSCRRSRPATGFATRVRWAWRRGRWHVSSA